MRCPTCGCRTIGLNAPTKKQAEVLAFLLNYEAKHGRFPTYDNIAEHFGYTSRATVHEHLTNLELKGWVVREARTEGGKRVISARAWAA